MESICSFHSVPDETEDIVPALLGSLPEGPITRRRAGEAASELALQSRVA